MILSDGTITEMLKAGDIGIHPTPEPEQIQPVSVDLLLSTSFVTFPMEQSGAGHRIFSNRYTLNPGQFILASTKETIKLPAHIMAQVHGKSTIARKGLAVHAAGLVDPGFIGNITLELFNMSSHPVPLFAGEAICQISFYAIDVAVQRPYGTEGLGSHYQGQMGAREAAE